MGAYFLVVNPAKREYLDPDRFGEGIKFDTVLRGDYCIEALKLLVSDCFRRDEASFSGAWLGDPVILASDDTGLPNPGGLDTATAGEPKRNLNEVAHAEFTDISYRALAELCRHPVTATELATRAREDKCLLVDLGATEYSLPALEAALDTAVGRQWRERYKQAQAENWWHEPLPPLNWPL
jgi:hypothetical protein